MSRPLPPAMPHGMTRATDDRLRRLPEAVRVRVLERASILHEAVPGMTWERADEAALACELGTQQELAS